MRWPPLLPVTLLVGALAASWAYAQPTDRERALEMGREALGSYDAGRWAEARDRFAAAEALVHSPVFLLYLGRAERQLGRLVAARAYFERVVREPLPDDAPPPWRSAQQEAATELAALVPTIPLLRLAVDPALGPAPEVLLDGVPLVPPPIGAAAMVDPGEHEIVVRSAAGPELRRRVTVPPQAGEVLVDFRTPPAYSGSPGPGPLAPGPTDGSAAPPPYVPEGIRPAVGLGIGALVLGGVSLTAFAITGVAAVNADAELEERCPDNVCSSTYESRVDEYYALANASTGTLVAGTVLVVTGTVLLAVGAPARQPHGVSVGWTLQAGPGSLGLEARF